MDEEMPSSAASYGGAGLHYGATDSTMRCMQLKTKLFFFFFLVSCVCLIALLLLRSIPYEVSVGLVLVSALTRLWRELIPGSQVPEPSISIG